MGDSKVIVDWTLKHQSLQSIVLHHWTKRVRGLLDSGLPLTILHVYREFNTHADTLSKQAIGLHHGLIYWKKFVQDSLIKKGVLNYF